MSQPYRFGRPLAGSVWERLRRRTIFDCCKWEVQSEDRCVLHPRPLFLDEAQSKFLAEAAESLACETYEAESELLRRTDLLCKLGLPGSIAAELRRGREPSPPASRVMRFDFHFTDKGWLLSEVNADVPGGFVEASGFTELMAEYSPDAQVPGSPADVLACSLSRRFENGTVAMVHATGYREDRQVVHYLANKFNARRMQTVMLSPAELNWTGGRASVATPQGIRSIDAVFRFYPAEWLPRLGSPSRWRLFIAGGHTPSTNPATAILVQSKRLPLTWKSLRCCTRTWERFLPETVSVSRAVLRSDDWVIKPAFGRVGESVGIRGVTPVRELAQIRTAAWWRPSAWIAQRRFRAVPLREDDTESYISLGIYVIDGKAAGVYGRVSRKPLIDHEAQDLAVLIKAGPLE